MARGEPLPLARRSSLRALGDSVGIATPCAQHALSDGTPRGPQNDRSDRHFARRRAPGCPITRSRHPTGRWAAPRVFARWLSTAPVTASSPARPVPKRGSPTPRRRAGSTQGGPPTQGGSRPTPAQGAPGSTRGGPPTSGGSRRGPVELRRTLTGDPREGPNLPSLAGSSGCVGQLSDATRPTILGVASSSRWGVDRGGTLVAASAMERR